MFLLTGRNYGQEYFLKFSESISQTEIQIIRNQLTGLNENNFYCPFKTPYDKLQKTYLITGKSFTPNDLNKIKQYPFIDYIEKVPEYHLFYLPNDLISNQWNLTQINAQGAWDETTGASVPIAIVDNAIQINHIDLATNIFINSNEIAGNGIDDDNNGYIDDLTGWDAADNDNDPSPPSNANSSYFSHGTHCSGISAAITDNGTGISSIGFNSKIIPVKIANNSTGILTGAYAGV
ncbi:MAG: S8 family serine peptidase, partial [Candidatus Lokiarchaeia archaeon]|nr:S8 family serine peptidase [Candidatus Lokiarchaeia archaeon]